VSRNAIALSAHCPGVICERMRWLVAYAAVSAVSCAHASVNEGDAPAAAGEATVQPTQEKATQSSAAPREQRQKVVEDGPRGECIRRPVRFPMPDPDPQNAHVTHAWPHWQWPSVYLQARPAFLVRIDQVVDPQAVLNTIRVAGRGMSSWQKIEWEIRACVIEQDEGAESGYTTIVFQPVMPLQAGVGGGYDSSRHTRSQCSSPCTRA
jgi:hypothetical protein